MLFPELDEPLQLPITKLLLAMDLSVLLLLLLSLLLSAMGTSLLSVSKKFLKIFQIMLERDKFAGKQLTSLLSLWIR